MSAACQGTHGLPSPWSSEPALHTAVSAVASPMTVGAQPSASTLVIFCWWLLLSLLRMGKLRHTNVGQVLSYTSWGARL